METEEGLDPRWRISESRTKRNVFSYMNFFSGGEEEAYDLLKDL